MKTETNLILVIMATEDVSSKILEPIKIPCSNKKTAAYTALSILVKAYGPDRTKKVKEFLSCMGNHGNVKEQALKC